MVPGRWYFRFLFWLEQIHGLYNPSLTDLGHSWWKKVYCLACLVIVVCLYLWFFLVVAGSKAFDLIFLAWGVSNCILVVFYIIRSITTFRTNISGIMNLTAIEEMLETSIKSVSTSSICSTIFICIIIFNYFPIIIWSLSGSTLETIIIIETFGIVLCLYLGCFGFLCSFLRIIDSINNQPRHGRQMCCGVGSNTRPLQVITVMRKTEAVLHQTVTEFTSWYRPYVWWITLWAAVVLPSTFISTIQGTKGSGPEAIAVMILGLYVLTCITTLVLCCALISRAQTVAMTTLSTMLARSDRQEDRRALRHRLLARIHRRYSFDCYFFDMELPLLLVILDTSLLVVCTMLDN